MYKHIYITFVIHMHVYTCAHKHAYTFTYSYVRDYESIPVLPNPIHLHRVASCLPPYRIYAFLSQ